MTSIQGCINKCPELTVEDAARFIRLHGREAITLFSNIDIEIRGGYIVDYKIDRKKYKLEENPKIKLNNINLRFNNNIRFFYKNNMTFEDFCNENDFDDSFYSLNYIHNDSLIEPKKYAYDMVSKLIGKLHELGLQETDSRLYCKENMRFYLSPRNKDYHVVMYVPDTSRLYPTIWKDFFKTQYSTKIKEGWYYYTYRNWLKYSDYYGKNNLGPKIDTNPCWGE